MRENKKNKSMKTNVSPLHIRRCHICGTTNETESALVDKCSHCGKFFAPFVFFDEKEALELDDQGRAEAAEIMNNRLKSNEWHHPIKTQYPPLWGITVYW
jgi:hypothetical protein